MSIWVGVHHFQQTGCQEGIVANPARGQLNRENRCFPLLARAWEFVSRVRFDYLVSRQLVHPGWIWCLLTWLNSTLPLFATVSIITAMRYRASPDYISHVIALPIDDVSCRESAGRGQVVLKVARWTGAFYSSNPMEQLTWAPLFPHPLVVRWAWALRD